MKKTLAEKLLEKNDEEMRRSGKEEKMANALGKKRFKRHHKNNKKHLKKKHQEEIMADINDVLAAATELDGAVDSLIAKIGAGASGDVQPAVDKIKAITAKVQAQVSGVGSGISAIAVSDITGSSASVGWVTDQPSDSLVEYGADTNYGSSTPLDASPVTTHKSAISGLLPSTVYHFRVKSKDASGKESVSSDGTFTTTV